MNESKIEWCRYNWPTVAGCEKVSPACVFCYALKLLLRLVAQATGKNYDSLYREVVDPKTGKWTGKVLTIPGSLDLPYRWKVPGGVFVNGLADSFHKKVPFDWIEGMFTTMTDPKLQGFWWQLLTKRSKRLREIGPDLPWTENTWAGVTIESEKYLGRLDDLHACGATRKWLSIEPLLGPMPSLDVSGLGWIVLGGESGNHGEKSRAMKPEWVREIRQKCDDAGVPMFFKQWGHTAYNPLTIKGKNLDPTSRGEGKSKGGRLLDGETVLMMPKQYEHLFPELML